MKEYPYRIYTNLAENRFLEGYTPGDRLVLAGAHGQGVRASKEQTNEVLETLFRVYNMDDRPNGREAPSMSVGDVVFLGEAAYAVQHAGFRLQPGPFNIEEGVYLDHVG